MALQPIARWNVVPHADVTGNYYVGMVAFHKDGIVNVGLRLGTSGPPITLTTMTLNPRTGVYEYNLPIPSSLIPSGNYVAQGFAIATTGSQQILPNLPVNIWQTTATYTDKYVNADTGSDAAAGTSIAPLLTIKKAVELLSANGNGGRIYLQDATATYSLAAVPSPVAVTTTRYLNIEGAPGSTRANVKVGVWAGLASSRVRFANVTITAGLQPGIVAGPVLWCENCHFLGPGQVATFPTAGWATGWSEKYFTGGDVTDCRVGLDSWTLVSGATFERIGGKMLLNCPAVIDVDGDVIDDQGTSGLEAGALSYLGNQSNVLAYGARIFDAQAPLLEILNTTGVTSLTQNAAFVNLVLEKSTGQDKSVIKDHQVEHLILGNCTFVQSVLSIRTNALTDFRVVECVLGALEWSAGDILGSPILDPANFLECHYTAGVPHLGFGATTGTPGFTNPSIDDYTPATGSVLFVGHTAPKLVASDAEWQPRANPTTVGALKGVDEGAGPGTVPPSALEYTPLLTLGLTGTAITPIVPTWQGTIETFSLEDSIYHLYQAPQEIACDSANAHFEVRAWTAGDPTDSTISGGHHICVVVDLRFGHVYLRNPKVAGNQAFSAMATAMNLCAPFASRAGNYTNSAGTFAIPNGPWPAERPIIRYRGQYLTGLNEAQGLNLSEGVNLGCQPDGGSNPYRTVMWAVDEPALGGFFPIQGSTSSGPLGKGVQIKLSVIGATGGKFDRTIGPTTMGYGFKNSGVADPTWAPIDILFKDLTFSCNFLGFVAGNHQGCFQTPDKLGKTGRLRLYDYGFAVVNPSLSFGYGVKTWIEVDGGAHFDFRRGVYPPAQEHANYIQGLNAGLLRNATLESGETPDSWFVDLVLPNGTNRCLFHLVDRPWDQLEQGQGSGSGGCTQPTVLGATKCRWGGKGIVLFERCQIFQGSENESASLFNMVTGADMTFILRSNEIVMQGQLGKGSAIPLPGGGSKTVTIHERGVLAYNENGQSLVDFMCPAFDGPTKLSARINENGFNTRRVVIIDHHDHVDDPSEKRMTFRGVEEVHLYSFDLQCLLGTPKPAIEIDELGDSSPHNPYYTNPLLYQFDLEGNLVYSASPSFGSPISNGGGFYPHTGRIYIYGADPVITYSGWIPGGQKMVGCLWPSTAPLDELSQDQVNSYAGTPVYMPTGLTLDPTTGVVSGTPTQAIGINPGTGTPLGLTIDSPGAYIETGTGGFTGAVRMPVKGSNSARGDSWTGGSFQLGIADQTAGGTQFITPPVIRVGTRAIPPAQVQVDMQLRMSVIRVGVTTFPPEFITDNGTITQIFAPNILMHIGMHPPGTDTDQTINLPVLRVSMEVLSGFILGGIEKGDFAGEVLTAGCEIGEVVA